MKLNVTDTMLDNIIDNSHWMLSSMELKWY